MTCRFVVECERRRRERRGEHAGVKEEEKEKMEKLKKRRRRRKKKKNPPPQNSNNAPGRTRRAISGARRTILSAGVACPRSCEREREKEEEVEFLKNRAFFFRKRQKSRASKGAIDRLFLLLPLLCLLFIPARTWSVGRSKGRR